MARNQRPQRRNCKAPSRVKTPAAYSSPASKMRAHRQWRLAPWVTPREVFAEVPSTLIPSYPDLPMENVYPQTARTNISCLHLRQPAGRGAYFPFDIHRTFWEVLCVDHLKLLRNTVLWAYHEAPIIEVDGPGFIDVTAWRNADSVTIHLVNLTNPMAMKGPYRDFFPIGPHTIRLKLPGDPHAKQARLLVAGKPVDLLRSGSLLTLNAPPPFWITRL
jgi:hypothetical protein